MITIDYLVDKNGRQQVIDMINTIIANADDDTHEYQEGYDKMRQRIAHGLQYISIVGIVEDQLKQVVGTEQDGSVFTLAPLVKPLKYHRPLYEFRVNVRSVGAFRAIFFYDEDPYKNQSIYFTKAIIKPTTTYQAFNAIAAESEIMRNDFYI